MSDIFMRASYKNTPSIHALHRSKFTLTGKITLYFIRKMLFFIAKISIAFAKVAVKQNVSWLLLRVP